VWVDIRAYLFLCVPALNDGLKNFRGLEVEEVLEYFSTPCPRFDADQRQHLVFWGRRALGWCGVGPDGVEDTNCLMQRMIPR
jgi:hypothetical protein